MPAASLLNWEAEADFKIDHRSVELYEFADDIAVTSVLWSILSMQWFRREFALWLQIRNRTLKPEG